MIIPYMTASSVLQIIPNEDKVFKTVQLEFTGTLRDYQFSIMEEATKQLEEYGTTTFALVPGL